jgi:cyclopropane fatty-acyl-phospholipid synthase-like methyltransferase
MNDMAGKLFFTLMYWLSNPPWDTGVTPPEVVQFLEQNPPGRALDLGCGTGTNVLTIAKYGWQVTGIDFIPRAIRAARRKIKRADQLKRVELLVGDVLDPQTTQGEFDLILDIGCFHSLSGSDVKRYQQILLSRLAPGGSLLLYVHLNQSSDSGHGSRDIDLNELESILTLVSRQDGEEDSRPSAWLHFINEFRSEVE